MDALTDALGSSPWTYLLVLALVAGDAVLPLVPGETAIITGAVLARQGDLSLPLLAIAAVVGAVLGDQAMYWIGRSAGRSGLGRLERRGSLRKQLRWGRDVLGRHGPLVVVVARFVPGGRSATNLAAGSVGLDLRRFSSADLLGACLWVALNVAIGTLGGAAFRDSTWQPLALSLAIAAALAVPLYALRHRLEAPGDGAAGRRAGRRRDLAA